MTGNFGNLLRFNIWRFRPAYGFICSNIQNTAQIQWALTLNEAWLDLTKAVFLNTFAYALFDILHNFKK